MGVEYAANSRFHPDAKPEVLTATARRLVVISAGALGSPAILERSGVGSKETLAKVGVEQIVDLPGVGDSYQGQYYGVCRSNAHAETDPSDHQHIFGSYAAPDDINTLDGIVTNDKTEIASE